MLFSLPQLGDRLNNIKGSEIDSFATLFRTAQDLLEVLSSSGVTPFLSLLRLEASATAMDLVGTLERIF